MKKWLYLLLTLVVLLAGFAGYHISQYDIENRKEDIRTNLNFWLSRGSENMETEIISVTQIDGTNSSIVLYKIHRESIGYALLRKGWNGKFKIENSIHGSNIASYHVIETNQGKYGIVTGKNPDLKIERIRAELLYENFEFMIDVSGQETFVMYEKLPEELEEPFPADLMYFDQEGSVIEVKELEN
ncbi:hypothetical protein FZC79_15445 [Rossellomorea vietnamensis]|uniref:Uncharacterized protein n=1 Tax=Rossellomorea vietnamensis TaxID=218284 RepID=A0A5D4KA88_9BACI|nr:hypothetical protein [Rossellomorea vietnamensis]TYR74208.1 hypothetical protein FZC79_15445 [Rossellomorea vietnamensis]